jgi:DNA-binding response OmpR family regulator
MENRTGKILSIDTSELRLQSLKRTLEKAGFEVWTAWGASDAICLASSVKFDALVADRESLSRRADMWKCLRQFQPELPVLMHEGKTVAVSLCGESGPRTATRSVNPEVILAMLILLLERESKVPLKRSTAA